MAANDPITNAGFSIPTLQQYQQMKRQQAIDSAGPNAPGYAKLMQQSIYDMTRGAGYLSPDEKIVGAGSAIQQDANDAAVASGETDPVKLRLAALTTMVSRFNAMGMSDLSAKAMPELVALQERQEQMRKLKAEGNKAQTDADVDALTSQDQVDMAGLKNRGTEASTDEAKANADFTRNAKTEEAKASAAASRANANEKTGEYQNYIHPQTGAMFSVLKTNARARAMLASRGYVEDNINLNPTKTGDLQMPKAEVSDLLKEMEQADETLDTYRSVAGQFKPEFLTLGGKVSNFAAGVAEGAGMKLSPEAKGNLDAFQQFRSGAVSGMNAYIKKIAGTAVSKAEELRVYAAAPDPLHDSPTQFVAKMRNTARLVIGYRERARKYLAAGGAGGMAPTGDAWDGVGVPAVTDAQVDQFLGRNFGIPASSSSATGTKTAPMTDDELATHYNTAGK